MRALTKLPPGQLTVLAAPDLHVYLNGSGSAAWQALARRHGDGSRCASTSPLLPAVIGSRSGRGERTGAQGQAPDGQRAARSAVGRACTNTGRSARRAAATSISGAGSARSTPCPRRSRATTSRRTKRTRPPAPAQSLPEMREQSDRVRRPVGERGRVAVGSDHRHRHARQRQHGTEDHSRLDRARSPAAPRRCRSSRSPAAGPPG